MTATRAQSGTTLDRLSDTQLQDTVDMAEALCGEIAAFVALVQLIDIGESVEPEHRIPVDWTSLAMLARSG